MSKKSVKLVSTILTIAVLVMAFAIPAFAAATDIGGVSVNPNTSVNGAANVTNVGQNILGIIQVVGTIIAVGVVMVLGIRYMMGSAEEKASYKKTMVPYIVGAVLLFAAANLAKYVYQFTQSI